MTTSLTTTLTEAQASYYEDLNRQRGNLGRLLELLLDGSWHPNYECASVGGLSFNDSLFTLRKEGWVIESRRKEGGVWEFRLLGRGEPDDSHRPMTRPQKLIARDYSKAIVDVYGVDGIDAVHARLPAWMQLPRL